MKNTDCKTLFLALLVLAVSAHQTHTQSTEQHYTFITLAGNVRYGFTDGWRSTARFGAKFGFFMVGPRRLAVDSVGNVYVADTPNHTIRKITPGGVVATLAGQCRFDDAGHSVGGSADGTACAAQFSFPTGVAVDGAGIVYVADSGNNTIRKITPTGVVATLAGLAQVDTNGVAVFGSTDGTRSAARFNFTLGIGDPFGSDHGGGVAVDSAGNVYVADSYNHTIRRITPAGEVTTLAGIASITNQFGFPRGGYVDGTGSAARFNYPRGVAVDSGGNVYVADSGNNTIRKVSPTGDVTTLAGNALVTDQNGYSLGGNSDGTGSAARFNNPQDLTVDSVGNVYVADGTIRKITPAGIVTTLAETGGCTGVAVDSAGDVYVVHSWSATIRKVTPAGAVTSLAGQYPFDESGYPFGGSADGMGSGARFYSPQGVAVDKAGNIYVADTANSTIRKVTAAGLVTTLAGLPGAFGSVDETGSAARFWAPQGVAVDSAGNIYVADTQNGTIRKVTPSGAVTTLLELTATDKTGSAARFYDPSGVAVDKAGNVYVADTGNNRIRKVTPAGAVTTLAGLAPIDPNAAFWEGRVDGTGSAARFLWPSGVVVDSAGNVYVGDSGALRKVTAAGVVTTLAGLVAECFNSSDGSALAVDSADNVYVADAPNQRIQKITPTGALTSFAGVAGGCSMAADSGGNIYVADTFHNTIRKGIPTGSIPAPVLMPPKLSAGQFGFGLTGLPGVPLELEVSVDLLHWQPAGTYVLEGGTNYCVSPMPVEGNRYYRARVR